MKFQDINKSFKIKEDDLRLAIQGVHDAALSEEYSKQEKLLLKVIELQKENQKLSSKVLGQ